MYRISSVAIVMFYFLEKKHNKNVLQSGYSLVKKRLGAVRVELGTWGLGN